MKPPEISPLRPLAIIVADLPSAVDTARLELALRSACKLLKIRPKGVAVEVLTFTKELSPTTAMGAVSDED